MRNKELNDELYKMKSLLDKRRVDFEVSLQVIHLNQIDTRV